MNALQKTLALLLILGSPLAAEESQLELQPGYTMRIEGTSNLRDWGADARDISVDFALRDWSGLASLDKGMFTRLALRVPVAEISSGTKGLSGKIHKYLKKKKHPFIAFTFDRVTDIRRTADTLHVRVAGTITAAGADHALTVDAALTAAGPDTLFATGRTTLQMTDFGIDPPTALFGTIRADDAFDVRFALPFSRRPPDHAVLH